MPVQLCASCGSGLSDLAGMLTQLSLKPARQQAHFRADAHSKQLDILNAEVLLNKLAWELSYHSLAELVKDSLAGLVKSRLGGLAKDRHTKAINCMLTSY